MRIWVEIHCDVLTGGRRPDDILRAICESNEGNHPGVMGSSAQRAYFRASEEAKKLGWKRKHGLGWVCPGCQKYGTDK